MKQLEQFFLLIDQCLNDTKFIRKHALSEKDFTRNRILTFRNTFWGLLAHTGASLQGEIPRNPSGYRLPFSTGSIIEFHIGWIARYVANWCFVNREWCHVSYGFG